VMLLVLYEDLEVPLMLAVPQGQIEGMLMVLGGAEHFDGRVHDVVELRLLLDEPVQFVRFF